MVGGKIIFGNKFVAFGDAHCLKMLQISNLGYFGPSNLDLHHHIFLGQDAVSPPPL